LQSIKVDCTRTYGVQALFLLGGVNFREAACWEERLVIGGGERKDNAVIRRGVWKDNEGGGSTLHLA
jgi:hypothetical protein